MYFLEQKITRTLEELEKQIFQNKTSIRTCEILHSSMESLEQAQSAVEWQSFAPRERWGGEHIVAWFRFLITVPEPFDGKPMLFTIETGREGEWYPGGPQYLVYINEQVKHGMDLHHREVMVTPKAKSGERYEVYIQGFSGVKDILTEMNLTLCTLDERSQSLYYDIKTAFEGAKLLSKDDKMHHQVIAWLNDASNVIDFRQPASAAYYTSLQAAATLLIDTVYAEPRWDSSVTAYTVGHTHLDVAWLWTIEDTRRKAVRTFTNTIDLMERYPEYHFICTQPQVYQYVKEDFPEVYSEAKKYIAQGRWEPEGGMWIEPDCNIPSGESFVRQLLLGKSFFAKEFAVDSRLVWLPDVFGFSPSLPQILKKSGIDYFGTTKISWNEYNTFPYDVFRWRGIDGSEVFSYFTVAHAANLSAEPLRDVWNTHKQKNCSSKVLVPFGWGDAGGGATTEMLETGQRLQKGVAGSPEMKMTTMTSFFQSLEQETETSPYLPTWVGELYLEYHRGTYTSMAKNKRYNRKSECLYHDAETYAALAYLLTGTPYPTDLLGEGWELIALNQFHDILPGTSIAQVFERSHRKYEQVLALGEQIVAQSLEQLSNFLSSDENQLILFNPLGFTASQLLELPASDYWKDSVPAIGQKPLEIQKTYDEKILCKVPDIPAKGYKAFELQRQKKTPRVFEPYAVEKYYYENEYYTVQIDSQGALKSFWDKRGQRSILAHGMRGNVLQLFEDMPYYYNDAWDISIYYQEKMEEIHGTTCLTVVEEGPLRTVIAIEKEFSNSTLQQNIMLYPDSPRIDFETTVDWHETFQLLKVAFPVNVLSTFATYDVQFGHYQRPTHWNTSWDYARFEVFAHKWADLSQPDFGVALLNDCKYGYDIKDNVMRLTLLKSSEYPNLEADRGIHHFTYSIFPHQGDVSIGEVVEQGYLTNHTLKPMVVGKSEKVSTSESLQKKEFSLCAIDTDHVIIETIKLAEDGDGVILRFYESHGKSGKSTVKFGLPIALANVCNLMEAPIKSLDIMENNQISLEFSPFEIKTVRINS